MLTSIAISIIMLVFLTYNITIYQQYGILGSISKSNYSLAKVNKEYLFTAFCWIGLTIPLWLISGEYGALFALSGIGFAFVGAASFFLNDKMTERVHYGGATVGIGIAFVALWVAQGLWVPFMAFLIGSGVFLILKIKNPIYWIEILAFVLLIFGMLLLN